MSSRLILLLFLTLFLAAAGNVAAQQPTVTTTAATGVTDLKATLNGTANANGGFYSISFEYGTTTSYGSTLNATPSFISGSNTVSVSAAVAVFLPNTTYHYRLKTSAGSGADMTFTTGAPATPPAVSGTVSAFVSATGLVFSCYPGVFSGSSAATVTFEYGTTTGYGSSTSASTLPINVQQSQSGPVASGLTPGTTYHVRCKVVNNEGTAYSDDAAFTTLAAPVLVTTAATAVTDLAATLNGTANASGGSLFVQIEYGLTTSYGLSFNATPSSLSGSNTSSETLTRNQLLPGTTYHYRLRAQDGGNAIFFGNDMTVTTAPASTPPSISPGTVSSVTASSGTVAFSSVSSGSSAATSKFEYGTSTSYGVSVDGNSIPLNTTSSLGLNLTGLTSNTVYHVRCKVVNNEGTTYSPDISFTTLSVPVVVTNAATGVTDLAATLNGTVNASGGFVNLTFDYGTTSSYGSTLFPSPSSASGSNAVAVTASLTGLQPSTTYHYRLRGQDGAGVTFSGADLTFTTGVAATPPTVTATMSASSLSATTAWVGVPAVKSGSSPATVYVEYGTTVAYGASVLAETVPTNTTGSSFSIKLIGLAPSTTYHMRCRAVNNEGTASSPDATFTTTAVPVVTTGSVTGVTDLAAVFNGTANAGGGSLSMSFEYGLTVNYGSTLTASPSTVSGGTTTAVTAAPTRLAANTTYHYRLRGQDAGGDYTYGADMSFIMAPGATAPTVTTGSASSVSAAKATLSASVVSGSSAAFLTFDYGPTTAYGSQANYPSILDTNSSNNGLSVTLVGLTPGTTYHFRARAANNEGTGFGADGSFTTLAVPVVVTTAATGVTDLAATFNGTANAGGGSLSTSFDYGLTTGYGTNISATPSPVSGSSTTSETAAPAGLLPATTYHYRLKGTDGGSIVYLGADMTVTTSPAATPPTATTSAASSVSPSGATLTATVGTGSSPTSLTFDYGLTTDYGSQMDFTSVLATNTSSSRSVTLAGLAPGTTYHFRARATNNEGVGVSVDRTFTTLTAPVITTTAATAVTDVAATFNGSANANSGGSVSLTFEYGLTTSYGSAITPSPSSVSGSNAAAVSALPAKLLPNTTYHYRLRGSEGGVFYYGDDATFTMAPPATVPTVTTGVASPVDFTTATLTASGIFSGSSTAFVSFEYGTTTAYGKTANYSTVVPVNSSLSSAIINITGLQPSTLYHFRARATNSEGVGYGADATFTTPAVPVVVTNPATGVSDISATFNGTADAGGGSLDVQFDYGTTASYSGTLVPNPSSVTGTGARTVFLTLSGLLPGTTYHYRLHGYGSSNGGYLGNDMTFTTAAAASLPNWTTASTGVWATSAAVSVTGFNAGSSAATLVVEYGTTPDYGMQAVYPGTLTGNTSSSLSSIALPGLTPGTLYHFRVKASNHEGTTNGADGTFTTVTLPTVSTGPPTGVTDLQATLNGFANANSGVFYNISFEYGTSTAYGASASPSSSSLSGFSFVSRSATVALQPATTYHYRTKLTDGVNSYYGSDATFTTNAAATPPTATTLSANQITATTAYLRASNVNYGSSPATINFLYGTTAAYGMTAPFAGQPVSRAWTVVSEGITGLQPSTTYHFTVTATNNEGSVTGNDLVFTTGEIPAVMTALASGVTGSSATLNGTVNPKGVASTFRFEYGLSTAYGSSITAAAVSGTTTLSRTATPTKLQPLTTYHYRSRLDNVDGTFYGDDATFTTGAASTGPSISSVSDDSVSSHTVILHANGVNAGTSTATIVFEYGPTLSYGAQVPYVNTVAAGSSMGAKITLVDLQPGTLYHYRAKVTNNDGVVYSADDTFLTLRLPVAHTLAATGVTDISAVLNGSSDAGGDNVSCFFEYGVTSAYGTSVFVSSPFNDGEAPVSTTVTGLLPSTTYHYHFYTTVDADVYDGGDMTFTTGPAVSLPAVITGEASVGASTTAGLTAANVSAGAAPATLSWEYGLDTSYGSTVNYSTVLATGSFSRSLNQSITGLAPGTSYHYRAKISNSLGTVYGDDVVFTTRTVGITSLSATTNGATLVGSTTATLNGQYSSNDSSSVISFDYGLDTNYGASAAAVKSSGIASAVLTGLLPNTTYHFRLANQTTSNGSAYGADLTFTTLDALAPAVATGTAAGTSGTGTGSAVFRGTVNPNGRPTIVCFEYGTTSGYGSVITTLPAIVTGNSDMAVAATAISLTNNATYHYRMMAMNDHGVSYGADSTVQVSQPPISLTTQYSWSGPNKVTLTGSSSGGSFGYFEWGTSAAYGTVVMSSNGGSSFSSATVSSLQYNTTYHFRYVVFNSSGYSYGDDVTLTTDYPSPTVSYQPVTGISTNSAVVNVAVTETGGADTLVCDFGASSIYGGSVLMNPSFVSGTGTSSASVMLTGLAPGKLYHYRTRMQRSLSNSGTSEVSGSDQSFTTLTLAEDWRRIHFGSTANSGDAADTANPSGDGINNLMKYALGLDPQVATSAVPQGLIKTYGPDQYLSLTFARDPSKTDVKYETQVADSPAGPWTTIAISAGGAGTSGAGFVGESPGVGGTVNVEVHDTVPMSGAVRRFIRLQVTR